MRSDRLLLVGITSSAFDFHALLLAEPHAFLRGMWQVAKETFNSILTGLPLTMGKDTRLASTCGVWYRTNRTKIPMLILGNLL